eukprot:g5517.t1
MRFLVLLPALATFAAANVMDDLESLLIKREMDPSALAHEIATSEIASIVHWSESSVEPKPKADAIPTVVAHGMGDSCFNPGMKEITNDIGKHLGSYAVCVPTGDSQIMDTINGFLKNMDSSVDVFAKKILADKNLCGPTVVSATALFRAAQPCYVNMVGFSQGNSLIRGYIQKYNGKPGYPTVRTFLSVHGTLQGVGGFPQCNPQKGVISTICRIIDRILGEFAYNTLVQDVLFQANYYRDPYKTKTGAYLKHSQLAAWNNEAAVDPEVKANFAKTEQFVCVKALGDTMIFPNEGEHWGTFADNSYTTILKMADTDYYKRDLFGLQTADKAGKIHFEETKGNHLQFTETELFGWIDKYF